jgi:glycosyltransferase involved in cell wall biosynthesis
MRVSYLVSDLGGGTGHHLIDLLGSRLPGAWDAELVSEVPRGPRSGFIDPITELPTPSAPPVYPVRQIARYLQLSRLYSASTPDILHTYFFWSILYGRMLKARGVVRRLVENREDLGFNWGPHEYALLSATRHLPDRVICVCEAVRQVVLEREGLSPTVAVTIRNGLNLETADDGLEAGLKEELGFDHRHKIVGMIANFERPVKGVSHFLSAIPDIVSATPDTRFVLIGGGRTLDKVEHEARRVGAAPYLRVTGFRTDVDRFYRIMDLSVLTSLSEGLSLTILESMKHGVPAVVTRVGGNPELVQDGVTGYLVPVRDQAAFVDRCVRLLKDKAARSAMSAMAKRKVRSFSIDKVAGRYGELYGDVLSSVD